MHTILQKQMSFEAQYNKNIKLTIDKPEKYRTWIMREQPWSQRKTHWAKITWDQAQFERFSYIPSNGYRWNWAGYKLIHVCARYGQILAVTLIGC